MKHLVRLSALVVAVLMMFPTAAHADSVPYQVTVAKSQIGVLQAPDGTVKYATWYDGSKGFWCAKFTSWVIAQAGIPVIRSDTPSYWAYKLPPTSDPQPGDVAYLSIAPEYDNNQIDHIGIVVAVDKNNFLSVEGNTGNPIGVHLVLHARNAREVDGFGKLPKAVAPRKRKIKRHVRHRYIRKAKSSVRVQDIRISYSWRLRQE